ncbi:MAG: bifunctional hydroxymethylpyrimidine kinase/phosphomethylpyrimidine kinase [Nitrospirae bacterium]|nr:bifunctional hydroxymethylpyrimidine kinase/phosphomethylpyrimidine kinase [Nitrospirota bacterium]
MLLKLPRSGHLKSELLFDGREYRWFTNGKAVPYEVRGTGCTLASAIAGHLAQRRPLVEAVADSLRWVRRLLGRTERVGHVRFFA